MEVGKDNGQREERKGWLKHLSKYAKPGKIIEFGCGSGFVLEILSGDYPGSIIFGVDKSMERLLKLAKKQLRYVVPVKADITNNIFRNGTFDTAIFVGVLHEIFSYAGKEKVEGALRVAYDVLKNHGILIIQDFLKPSSRLVRLTFKNKETQKRFFKFAKEFQPRKIKFERTESGVIIDIADAVEFISKYRSPSEEDWNEEMHETHFFFTEEEYRETAQETGFSIKHCEYLTKSDKRWVEVRQDIGFGFENEYQWIQMVLARQTKER
jgi:SAM-dependent methyltransferase